MVECPFCENEKNFEHVNSPENRSRVRCMDCGAEGPEAPSIIGAEKFWDKRPEKNENEIAFNIIDDLEEIISNYSRCI